MGMLNNLSLSLFALCVLLVPPAPMLNPHPPTLTLHSSFRVNSSTTSLNPPITFTLLIAPLTLSSLLLQQRHQHCMKPET